MKQVFLIEDDHDLRQLLYLAIKSLGVEVEVFPNANSFLKTGRACDLFIIDLNLPDVNGLVLCRQIKSIEDTKRIPVIIISANPDLDKLAIESCADDYLFKPFTIQNIKDKIRKHIKDM